MNQKEENEREWENPDNWKWHLFYVSSKDIRIWVPKKARWAGWTLNLGRKQSYFYLFLIVILIVILRSLV